MKKLKSLLVAAFLGIAATVSAQTADDRPLFDVVGNVKTITAKGEFAKSGTIINYKSVSFSKTGSILKIDGRTLAGNGIKITSRTKGLPNKVRFTEDGGYNILTIRYNSKRKPIDADDDWAYRVYKYDATGRQTKVDVGDNIGTETSYKYVTFDTKGNWTKRTATSRYYELDENGKKVFYGDPEITTEVRTITYY